MNYIVNGYDYKDANAMERRLEARELHLKGIEELKNYGNILYAAAMLNENGDMCGSTLIMEFENPSELDGWLEVEPYIVNKVWEKVDVIPCKVPTMFR